MTEGDLVHIIADGADWGLGIIVEKEEPYSYGHRVMLSDGKMLYFHTFEMHRVNICETPDGQASSCAVMQIN